MYLCNVIAKVSCVRHNQASLILLSLALPLHCICKGSECSAVGSALRSGRRGRAFESPHSDRKWELFGSHFSVVVRRSLLLFLILTAVGAVKFLVVFFVGTEQITYSL